MSNPNKGEDLSPKISNGYLVISDNKGNIKKIAAKDL